MTFAEWQQLAPDEAARELLRRAQALPKAQRRAAIVRLPSATELEARFAAAPSGTPLAGVPYFLKDLFDVAGEPTLAGSTFLPEVRPTPATDSVLVTALRTAGAVLAGKTHLHEFAYGLTGENPHYGDCEHPRFPGRTSGGSSSGSAAVVAADIAPFAIGTDTAGSIRVPAAFCGLFGLRLMPHHPWIADAFPLAPSYDTAGWFTATAADLRTAAMTLLGLHAGEQIPRGVYLEPAGLESDVADACRKAVMIFASPADRATHEAWSAVMASAAASYNVLASLEVWAVHAGWAERFRDRYDPAVWQRLVRPKQWTPQQIDGARVGAAAVRRWWVEFFRIHDFLVLPATPMPALTKAKCTAESRARLLDLVTPVSLAGLPVLTAPIQLANGLTTGLQIVMPDTSSPVLPWALDACVRERLQARSEHRMDWDEWPNQFD
jgi:aspartyl-tRNA(Asn)/glutamyl-tRNA(Gln) amidotransferase subunit A